MELPEGRIKLEIPLADDGSSNSTPIYATEQQEYLSENLRRFQIAFDDVVQTAVEEPGLEKFLIYNYKIRSSSFSRDLLPAIRGFLYSIQQRALHIPHFLKATVIIHSTACFSKEIISCHKFMPISAIFFGNIQGGVFINHWEVSYRDWNDHKEEGAENDKMHADFLYDQHDVVRIAFENKELYSKTRDRREITNEGIAHYQVIIRLNNIRRIIVDNAINDKNGRDRTRFHFELNCPVVIRRGFVPGNNHGNKVNNVQYFRYRTINRGYVSYRTPHVLAISDSPVFTIELGESLLDTTIYFILSRIRMRSGISIEFASLQLVNRLYYTNCCPYACWTRKENEKVNAVTDEPTMKKFIRDTVRKEDVEKADRSRAQDLVKERSFSLVYLIECLISRGAIVKDQLLLDKTVWIAFLKVINFCYRQAREACLCALERIITMIDERKRLGSIIKAFVYEYKMQRERESKLTLSWQEIKDGYRRVRKLVITQSRVIYVVPETIMANRVVRRYDHDGTRIIRVTFRDDDNQTMRTSRTSKYLIEVTLGKYLKEGVLIAGRDFGYLGSSNSQMRDSGAYFLEKYSRSHLVKYRTEFGDGPLPITWQPKIDEVREKLGRFMQVESIPKLMARLGQCFTQSKKTGTTLIREDYYTTYDFIGGSDNKGKEYTFSDGVGMISKDLAAEIAKEMQMGSCVPSCFQFRFRGMKGVLAVDPILDEIASWAEKFNIEPPQKKFGSWNLKLVFRPSQRKFEAMRTSSDSLEVVKFSSPVPVALNKPFICILDQVSEMQSHECHFRITNRIEELVDTQLRGMARTMLREHDCRNKLKELPRRIDVDKLSLLAGFQLSTEPFFRSLIKATIKFFINKQMRKQQIQIPSDKGRTMLGVVDETGQLQFGQIFVQYTENIALKNPPPSASRKILTGKVLLTKNPCIVPGDVRVFTAVDVAELHHLCDVVVFPIHGPRPHPDEMAGSDLDGDEYAVIWDENLLLDRNEEAFDYTADKPETKPVSKETLSDDMIDFFIKYITQEAIGTISNSFLFQADLYGIKSEVCKRLAMKISKAVDFTKTGLPPDPLVKDWSIDEESGKEIPPEKNERHPDFHLGNDYDPIYRSPRLLGRIYREFKGIEDVLKISEDIDEQEDIECDECLIVDGWSAFKEAAEAQLAKYKGRLRAIMENYGIKTEGEIFSGCICEMRNRISDRDQDDMSFFNTTEVIEKKVTVLFREFREQFFEEFGGWISCTQKVDKKFALEDNVFHRFTQHPTLKMQQKAVAYYRTCYETARQTRERVLSFAWIAYDVLAVVRQECTLQETDSLRSATPLYKMLRERLSDYCERNSTALRTFMDFTNGESCYELRLYVSHYPGLRRVMFIVCEWAKRNKLISTHLQYQHICLILILYATGQIAGCSNRNKPFLEKLEDSRLLDNEMENIDDEYQIKLLVAFFEYLASHTFRKLPYINFSCLGYTSVFLRGEWLPMHQVAIRTYYNMVFNLQFDDLCGNQSDAPQSVLIHECEPFIIELPEEIDYKAVENRMLQKTGVEDVRLRRLDGRYTGRVAVLARGTLQSLQKLRNLAIVKPPVNTAACGKQILTHFLETSF